ncbi:hypothetical protein BJX70DRAFT_400533 [Aspergillus crustosus]
MDPFERLPFELIEQILLSIDFATVESLLSASPRIHSIFQAQPTLVQALIHSNQITSMPEIAALCYNISFIHSSDEEACSNLSHYKQLCAAPKDVAFSTFLESWQFIRLAAHIQRLACLCLTHFRRNLVAAVNRTPLKNMTGPQRAQKASTPFSWTEEYRVYFSLWHLQHYSSLRNAARGPWHWSPAEIHELKTYNQWNGIGERVVERIWTVASILSDLGLKEKPFFGGYPMQRGRPGTPQFPDGGEAPLAAWGVSSRTPIPFLASLELAPVSTNNVLNPKHTIPIWTPPPIPATNKTTTPETRSWEQPHVEHFRNTATVLSLHRPPLSRVSQVLRDIRPFRRLGLVIWDSGRMESLGLCRVELEKRGGVRIGVPGEGEGGVGIWGFGPRWVALVEGESGDGDGDGDEEA